MNIARTALALALVSVGIAFVACGGENANTEPKSPETTGAPMGSTTAGSNMPSYQGNAGTPSATGPTSAMPMGPQTMSSGASSTSSGMSTGSPGTTSSLSDAQIAEVASDVNQGELDQAKYVIAHSKSQQVLQFAKHMVSDHTDIGQKMTSLLQAQSMTPATSATSSDVKSSGQQVMMTMQGKTGKDLDRAYIDAQVKEHQDALDMLDNKLIPGAQNAQLKSALQDVRTKVAGHLTQAQSIQASFGTSGTMSK